MKLWLKALGALLALSSSAVYATPYTGLFDYSYTYDSGASVSGSFVGTANDGLVTDLSDITASVDGTALNGSGELFAASYTDAAGWQTGGAQVAFNGALDNFIFIDSNFPTDGNYTNYVYIVKAFTSGTGALVQGPSGQSGYDTSHAINSSWQLSYEGPVGGGHSVPEPGALALLAMGVAALLSARKRLAA